MKFNDFCAFNFIFSTYRKVHVTKATLQNLIGRYNVEVAVKFTSDPKGDEEETYFISPKKNEGLEPRGRYLFYLCSTMFQPNTEPKFLSIRKTSLSALTTAAPDLVKIKLDMVSNPKRTKSIVERIYEKNLAPSSVLGGGAKMVASVSKIVDFWEASSPFSNLVRRRSSQHIRMQVCVFLSAKKGRILNQSSLYQSLQLIRNTFDTQQSLAFRRRCLRGDPNLQAGSRGVVSDFDLLLRHFDGRAERQFWRSLHEPVAYTFVLSVVAVLCLAVIKLVHARS